MKTRSILTKSLAVAALSVTGLVAANTNNNDQKAQAAVVQNDASVYTTATATTVYNNYENPSATGQVLAANTQWKIIKTAYDSKGQKWYDLGQDQWVLANAVKSQTSTAKAEVKVDNTQSTSNAQNTQASYKQTQSTNNYNQSANYNYNNQSQNYASQSYNVAPKAQTYTQTANTTSTKSSSNYTSTATGSEASAKAWIASKESGGSYSARNGQYVGKYQLSASYLNGDYSASNQEKAADNYVKSRYGSWSAAKSFWQSNGWY